MKLQDFGVEHILLQYHERLLQFFYQGADSSFCKKKFIRLYTGKLYSGGNDSRPKHFP